MTIHVEAVFKNGVFEPKKPLALGEGAKVRLAIQTEENYDPLDAVIGIGESGRRDGARNHDKHIYRKRRS